MYKEVNNNVAGAVKVIADASYTSIRYAFFPCCYDEDRNAWKGVECYENGNVGNMWLWFTKCYLLEVTGEKTFMGFIPRRTEWLRTDETLLIPLWHNSDGYSQYKGTDAKRVYGVIANTGADNDIFVKAENGEFKFECKGFASDDVHTDSKGNACVRVPERKLKPAVVFGNAIVKYERLLTWDEDEL